MTVTVTRYHESEQALFDPLQVVLDIDGDVVLSGDRYHDQIESQVQGFIKALDHLGLSYDHVEGISTDEPW